MKRLIVRVAGVGMLLCCSSALAQQGPPAPQPTVDQRLSNLEAGLSEIATALKGVEAKLAQPMPAASVSADDLQAMKDRLADMESKLASLTDTKIAPLYQQLYDLQDQVRAAPRDVNLLSKMSTHAGRQEVRRAVQGKLLLQNNTGAEQMMMINGVQWRVPSGASHLHVPFGVVTANLPWESSKSWDDWQFVNDENQLKITIGF